MIPSDIPDADQHSASQGSGGQTLRLFVALPVPETAARSLSALPHRGLEGARWTHPGDMHITLRFLGDLESPDLEPLTAALRRVRRPAFHVEVRGLGIFESARQAVLYAQVESARRVTTLCAEITDALTPLGFDFGMRPFLPHITLARTAGGRALETWRQAHEGAVSCHWKADRFALMRSAPPDSSGKPGGRHYTILEEFGLKDG